MIEKNPLTTLFSTSEGLSFLAYMAMVVYGMVTGQVDFMEGIGLLGAGAGGWGLLRTAAKKGDKPDVEVKQDVKDVKAQLLDLLAQLQKDDVRP
jgi:hypothetical protein